MIHVCPLSQVPEIFAASRPSHLISLMSVDWFPTRPAGLSADHHLALSMHDIVDDLPGMVAPSRAHVEALLAFSRHWERQAPLLIHCYAGISRSTAAAYIIAAAHAPERDELELALTLRRLSPSATPNSRLIWFADDILQRNGRMVAAIDAIGRGQGAYEGKPFELTFF